MLKLLTIDSTTTRGMESFIRQSSTPFLLMAGAPVDFILERTRGVLKCRRTIGGGGRGGRRTRKQGDDCREGAHIDVCFITTV